MDARAEELIVGRLAAAFPDDAVLAEERGASAGRSGRRWIIDPLDGTTNYAHGLPTFAVSIGLEVDRHVELGVVFDPNLDELFVAERGRGATVNDRPWPSPPPRRSTRACWRPGFRTTSVRRGTTTSRSTRRSASLRAVRRMGSAVLYLAWLATGRLDGYWGCGSAPGTSPPAVFRRGGRRPHHQPERRRLDLDAPALVASNGRVHGAIVDVLRSIRDGGAT